MIFNRSYRISSNKNALALKQLLIGKHKNIHGLDFEVVSVDKDKIRIVPHAEEHDEVLTLPITRLDIKDNTKGGSSLKLFSHPRLIDVGGPYILVIACIFLIIASYALGHFGGEDYATASKIGVAIPVVVLVLFWIRMEMGYFDYVRKVKSWIKQEVK